MDNFGPISMSGFKSAATQIFEALSNARRILVSKHDRVVAAIEPHTTVRPELLALYATPGTPPLPELSATTINQGSPSALVNRAIDEGVPSYVTRERVVYGVLHAPSEAQLAAMAPSYEQLDWIERRLDEVSGHPSAGIEALVGVGDEIAQHASVEQIGSSVFYDPAAHMFHRQVGSPYMTGVSGLTAAAWAPGAVERSRREGRRLWELGSAAEEQNPVLAQEAYGAAASHGDVRAMLRLAARASALGHGEVARFWYESAIVDEPVPGPVMIGVGDPSPYVPAHPGVPLTYDPGRYPSPRTPIRREQAEPA